MRRESTGMMTLKKIADWESLGPLLKGPFTNDTEKGERPNQDEILMVKVLNFLSKYKP